MTTIKGRDSLQTKLGKVSAKTLSLGAKQFVRSRNEQKVCAKVEQVKTSLTSSSRTDTPNQGC